MRAGNASASLGILGHHAAAVIYGTAVVRGLAAQTFSATGRGLAKRCENHRGLGIGDDGVGPVSTLDPNLAGIAGHQLHGWSKTHHLLDDYLLCGGHNVFVEPEPCAHAVGGDVARSYSAGGH